MKKLNNEKRPDQSQGVSGDTSNPKEIAAAGLKKSGVTPKSAKNYVTLALERLSSFLLPERRASTSVLPIYAGWQSAQPFIHLPILNRFGNMRRRNIRATGQVGNGARDLQHAVVRPRRQAHALNRGLQ